MNKKLDRKKQKQVHRYVRAIIQLILFLLVPSAFTAAFSGVKYIFRQMGAGAVIENNSFLVTLIWLCLFTICFGRIFCGFACAFGTLGDAVYGVSSFLCKKMKRKPFHIPPAVSKWLRYIKYIILAFLVVVCFLGKDNLFAKESPWEVFSLIYAGHLNVQAYIPGILILIGILVGMFFQERFFCQYLCPMGAVFSLLPVLPIFSYSRSKAGCIRGCSACSKKCPMDLNLPYEDEDGSEATGECIRCGKCQVVCPRQNVCPNVVYMMNGEERSIE